MGIFKETTEKKVRSINADILRIEQEISNLPNKKFNDSRVTALRGRIAALENQRKALIGQRAARILELEREIPVLERNSQNVHNDPYASSKAKSDQLRRLAKAKTELAELKKQKD
ncbi:hypothetical protein J4405_05540 [Candidatus Woesearchaeota archaeon]|nr:hypothetical protein [Candidatus Woesearchaeota archaeon]